MRLALYRSLRLPMNHLLKHPISLLQTLSLAALCSSSSYNYFYILFGGYLLRYLSPTLGR